MKTLTALIQVILIAASASMADSLVCSPVSSDLQVSAVPPVTLGGTYSTKGCSVTVDTETGRVKSSCGVTVIGINFYDIRSRLTGAYHVQTGGNMISGTPSSYSRCTAAMKPEFAHGMADTSRMACEKGSFKYVMNDSTVDIPLCIERSPDGYGAVIARADELPDGYITDSIRAIPVLPGVYAVCGSIRNIWRTNPDGTKECADR